MQKTLSFVLTFVSRSVFIQVFGVEMLGINGLFTNVLSILSLADLGFSTAMTFSYYKPIAENDEKKIAALNHFYKKVYLFIALGVTVIGIAIVPFLKSIINLQQEIDGLYIYYFLTLANTVVSYLFVYKTTILHAHQQGYIVSKYSMIMNIASTVAQIAFMLLFSNYILYLSIAIIFNLINNFYVSNIAEKKFPYIKHHDVLPKSEKKDIFANLGSVFLYKVSSVLMNSTDNIIISKYIGTVVVGYYSNYLTVVNSITSYVSIAFSSLTASIGNLIVKDSGEKQYSVFREIQVISAWFCIVVSSCVYALINDFIDIWLGDGFLLDDKTVLAIGINFFLTCVLNPIWIYREAAGIYKKTKYIMVICAIINIVLSVWWAKLIGLSGVLFASAASKLLTYIWYEPIILFRGFFKKSPLKFFLNAAFITAVTALSAFIMRLIGNEITLSGISGFIVKAVAFFAFSNSLFFIIYFRSRYLKSLLKRMKFIFLSFIKRK